MASLDNGFRGFVDLNDFINEASKKLGKSIQTPPYGKNNSTAGYGKPKNKPNYNSNTPKPRSVPHSFDEPEKPQTKEVKKEKVNHNVQEISSNKHSHDETFLKKIFGGIKF